MQNFYSDTDLIPRNPPTRRKPYVSVTMYRPNGHDYELNLDRSACGCASESQAERQRACIRTRMEKGDRPVPFEQKEILVSKHPVSRSERAKLEKQVADFDALSGEEKRARSGELAKQLNKETGNTASMKGRQKKAS